MTNQNDTLRIEALASADIDELRELAHAIWHRHYPSIISTAQIDYMLAQRYSPEVIAQELRERDVWWHKAVSGARMVGFSACVLSERNDELKLDKLYVDTELQRRGIGAQLIDNAARLAAHLGKTWLVLAVNKNNAPAIAAYEKHGFAICESVVKEIGEGFVMDDFIMARHVEKATKPISNEVQSERPKSSIWGRLGLKRQR